MSETKVFKDLRGFSHVFHFEHDDGSVSLDSSIHRVKKFALNKIQQQDSGAYVRTLRITGTASDGKQVEIEITMFSEAHHLLKIQPISI